VLDNLLNSEWQTDSILHKFRTETPALSQVTLAVKEMGHHVQSTCYISAHHSESVNYQLQLQKDERNAKELGDALGQICFH